MFCGTSVVNSCARCIPHSVCPAGMVVKLQGDPYMHLFLANFFHSAHFLHQKICSTEQSNKHVFLGKSISALRGFSGFLPSSFQSFLGTLLCPPDGLVEKTPCTWNSSRVCECQPGMFCAMPVTNSCARCVTRPNCPPGMVTKLQGKQFTSPTKGLSSVSLQPCLSPPPTNQGPSFLAINWGENAGHHCVSGPVLFWVILILVVVVSFSSFVLCHRRACRKWIGQSKCMYPWGPGRAGCLVLARPGSFSLSGVYCGSERLCVLPEATQQEWQSWDGDPPLPPGFCTAGALVSSPPPPFCLAENIYIMKADTVIVGTVKAEVPEGQGPMGPARPELEEELETDYASHYPEQETEPPLGSCGDVMFSVEEEGKEDPLPT
ncbi:hypothetical protein MJT46_019817, partial [Ovis ammon polii x Ovis aries]